MEGWLGENFPREILHIGPISEVEQNASESSRMERYKQHVIEGQ